MFPCPSLKMPKYAIMEGDSRLFCIYVIAGESFSRGNSFVSGFLYFFAGAFGRGAGSAGSSYRRFFSRHSSEK